MAEELAPQDGLYTLITRGADGDTFEVIGALVAVHPADEHARIWTTCASRRSPL